MQPSSTTRSTSSVSTSERRREGREGSPVAATLIAIAPGSRTPTFRALAVGVVAVVAIVVALYVYSTATSAPAQISYHGTTYGGMAKVDAIEIEAHDGALHATGTTIDGKPVFVTAGARPQVVALQLSPGVYDAYQPT
jgi:hypothetical protein